MALKIYGNQTVNAVWIKNHVQTVSEYSVVSNSDTKWVWDSKTSMLCKFNNNLIAGNVDSIEQIIKWRIYRCDITNNNSIYKFVSEVDVGTTSIRDFVVGHKTEYKWQLLPVTANHVCDPIYSSTLECDFFYWCLVDEVDKSIFKFQLKLDGDIEGKYTVNSSVNITTNHSQFPVVSFGKPLYRTNTINALIGNIDSNCNYSGDTNKSRDTLIEFLNNGHNKLLKTARGSILEVQTYTNDYGINNELTEMPQTINFSFVEVGSVDDISLYDELILV